MENLSNYMEESSIPWIAITGLIVAYLYSPEVDRMIELIFN